MTLTLRGLICILALDQKSAEAIVGRNEPSPWKKGKDGSLTENRRAECRIGGMTTSVYHESDESIKRVRELLLLALNDRIKETCRRAEPGDATGKNDAPAK